MIFQLPLLNGLTAPGRFMFIVGFCAALLSGFGIENLLSNKKTKLTQFFPVISLSFLIFLFVLIGRLLSLFSPNSLYDFIKSSYGSLGYVVNLDNKQQFLLQLQNSLFNQTNFSLFLILLTLLFVILLSVNKRNYLIKVIILVVLVVDIFSFGQKINKDVSFNNLVNDSNFLTKEVLNKDFRIYSFSDVWSDFMPNQLMPLNIMDGNGFASLPLSRFIIWQEIAQKKYREKDQELFKTGSVNYVYDPSKSGNSLLTVEESLPRIYFTNNWENVNSSNVAIDTLSNENYKASTTVVETSIKDNNPESKILMAGKISEYRSGYVKGVVDSTSSGLVVLTDTFFPGWEVFVNGEKSKIYPVNYLFRGVFVNQGFSIIEYKYSPVFFKESITISFLTTIFIFSYGIILLWKKLNS